MYCIVHLFSIHITVFFSTVCFHILAFFLSYSDALNYQFCDISEKWLPVRATLHPAPLPKVTQGHLPGPTAPLRPDILATMVRQWREEPVPQDPGQWLLVLQARKWFLFPRDKVGSVII